jgi:hypothetical protein
VHMMVGRPNQASVGTAITNAGATSLRYCGACLWFHRYVLKRQASLGAHGYAEMTNLGPSAVERLPGKTHLASARSPAGQLWRIWSTQTMRGDRSRHRWRARTTIWYQLAGECG